MPTYEYRCDGCKKQVEAFQMITARPLRKCPRCGQNRLKRLIGTGAAVMFKGGGFYQTDYRSEGYKKSAEAEKKSAEPKSETKSDTKVESKSADAQPKETTKPKKKRG